MVRVGSGALFGGSEKRAPIAESKLEIFPRSTAALFLLAVREVQAPVLNAILRWNASGILFSFLGMRFLLLKRIGAAATKRDALHAERQR
jgi:hypothetical protein